MNAVAGGIRKLHITQTKSEVYNTIFDHCKNISRSPTQFLGSAISYPNTSFQCLNLKSTFDALEVFLNALGKIHIFCTNNILYSLNSFSIRNLKQPILVKGSGFFGKQSQKPFDAKWNTNILETFDNTLFFLGAYVTRLLVDTKAKCIRKLRPAVFEH